MERSVLHDASWITQHCSILDYLYQPYVQEVEISLLGKRDIPLQKIWLKHNTAASAGEGETSGNSRW